MAARCGAGFVVVPAHEPPDHTAPAATSQYRRGYLRQYAEKLRTWAEERDLASPMLLGVPRGRRCDLQISEKRSILRADRIDILIILGI